MQEEVKDLVRLLVERDDLSTALSISLENADRPGKKTLEEFYTMLEGLLTHIPNEKELMPSVREFYYLISHSPGDFLRKDKDFNDWMLSFVNSCGAYLNTPESVQGVDTFLNNPQYNADDYVKGPGVWLSFNQFLARQMKPGRRPIAARCDDRVLVSPVDGSYQGQWNIEEDSSLVVKRKEYSIKEFLAGSDYANKFEGGTFTHIFLEITDYHRYHVPVGGLIKEVRQIPGGTWINEGVKSDGEIKNIDDVGFQFAHTRASMIIESALGLVAIIPVGMGHISSTTITAEVGTTLQKGEEFGYFAFGGSDIVMLFQAGQVKLTARIKSKVKQGEKIGFGKS
jgi:phosphatidylserine decarboxylase